MSQPDFLAVLDFEATCERNVALATQEVIEFPVVLVDTTTGQTIDEAHSFVKPLVEPRLTRFCMSLTGITQVSNGIEQGMVLTERSVNTQDQVNGGVSFVEALGKVEEMLTRHAAAHGLGGSRRVLFVTCGDWDLKTMLPKQCATSSIVVPAYMRSWCNIKKLYKKTYGREARGMTEMLTQLNIPLVGRHHSGIDDARNIAAIARRMLADGAVFFPTTTM